MINFNNKTSNGIKKILVLGLMFAMFAPFGVFASCTAIGTGGYYSTIPGATCTEDGDGNVTESVPPSSAGMSDSVDWGSPADYGKSNQPVAPVGTSEVYGTGDYAPSSGVYGTGAYVPPASTGLSGGVRDVSSLVSFLIAALRMATTLILGAAVVFFLWGVFKFVKNADNEEAQEAGKNQIIYGIIGIAVMVSLWGLVRFLTNTAGFTNVTPFAVPSLPLPPGN